MLWYKSWLETRLWFFLGVMLLAGQVLAFYMSYPLDPLTSYPHGALGVLPEEMARLRTTDFRSYVWLRWFSTTMLIMWPVFALRLAGTGLESASGREYLLSLPVTRTRIVTTRLAVSFVQIGAITLLPTLLLCAMAPLVGQRFPLTDALIHSVLLLCGTAGLFGLMTFLRAVTTDLTAYMAVGAAVILCGLFTFVAAGFTPYSIFRLMNGADYFFNHRMPWTGLLLSLGSGSVLIWLSSRIVERRDF